MQELDIFKTLGTGQEEGQWMEGFGDVWAPKMEFIRDLGR
jgi:hypothetical protein